MLCVCVCSTNHSWCIVGGVNLADSEMMLDSAEPKSVNQLSCCESQTSVSQGAVLFLDHAVVSVDRPATVMRLNLSSSDVTVCDAALNLVRIIVRRPFELFI